MGIIYNYGRYGHEGSLTNDIKDPYSKDTDGNALSNDDKIQVREANLVAGPEGYAFTTYTDFATYSIDKWYNSWGIRDSVKLAFDHIGPNGFAKDEFYIYNCAIGNLVPEFYYLYLLIDLLFFFAVENNFLHQVVPAFDKNIELAYNKIMNLDSYNKN